VQEAQEQALVSPAIATRMLAMADGRPDAITGPIVTAAAEAGDVAALGCFDELGRWLGRGMAQLAAILDPGVFVIGGGVSSAGELLRQPALQTYRKHLTGRGHRPTAEIRMAELGPEAGIVGAADLARRR
jgi:glucokinase